MSLDVYLEIENARVPVTSGIFIREGGSNREITPDEWNSRYPDREPVMLVRDQETDTVYSANITHNLNTMAEAAGIYEHLWRPDEIGVSEAAQLIEPLETGLALLKSEPEKFKAFNPENGWGSYDGLVSFVEKYLSACKEYPEAKVSVSR